MIGENAVGRAGVSSTSIVTALAASRTKEPFIHAEDIADVVVEALMAASHSGQFHAVTGPRLLIFADANGKFAKASGRRIRSKEILVEEYDSLLEKHEVPSEYVPLVLSPFTTVLVGRNESLTEGVQCALGRERRDSADHARNTAATGV